MILFPFMHGSSILCCIIDFTVHFFYVLHDCIYHIVNFSKCICLHIHVHNRFCAITAIANYSPSCQIQVNNQLFQYRFTALMWRFLQVHILHVNYAQISSIKIATSVVSIAFHLGRCLEIIY